VFVDTSVWFAAANSRDRHNERAKRLIAELDARILTDHVLVETWGLLRSSVHRRAAEGFWLGIRSGVAEVEKATLADVEAAWAIGESFPDQDFSIMDRTSFAVMERLGIRRVASFDDDFRRVSIRAGTRQSVRGDPLIAAARPLRARVAPVRGSG
jgi:predicted nucleic acid-binding protein